MIEINRKISVVVSCLILSVLFLSVFSAVEAQVVPEGFSVSVFDSGIDGPMFLEFGPGGKFGNDLYVVQAASGGILRIDPSGQSTTFGQIAGGPSWDMAFSTGGSFGNYLYVGGQFGIYRIDSTGAGSLFSSGGAMAMEFGPGGDYGTNLYVTEGSQISTVNSAGERTLFASGFSALHSLTFDSFGFYGGKLYVSDGGSGTVYEVNSLGSKTPLATIPPKLTGLQFSPGGAFGNALYQCRYVYGASSEICSIETDGSWSVWASEFIGGIPPDFCLGDIAFATGPPYGPAMYVADAAPIDGCVYKIMPRAPAPITKLDVTFAAYFIDTDPTRIDIVRARGKVVEFYWEGEGGDVTGDIAGTIADWTSYARSIYSESYDPDHIDNNRLRSNVVEVFTVPTTIEGRTGSITVEINYRVDHTEGTRQGTWSILDGSSGLAGALGHGMYDGEFTGIIILR